MNRLIVTVVAAMALGGCAADRWEPELTTAQQRLERQERIERQMAERQRLCAMMNKDTERYERDCERAGDPE